VINAICDNALMLALSEATRVITLEHIQLVCGDLHLATPALPKRIDQMADPKSAPAAVEEMPALVRRAAVGGAVSATLAPAVAPAAKSTPPPRKSTETKPALETPAWSAERPSLLKKWRGFLDMQKPSPQHKDLYPLSIKKHI
jgi:hypothetical protein